MILIAPDKYRGTLTATEAAGIMDANIPGDTLTLPMADGGEGTADAIAVGPGWETLQPGVKVNRLLRLAVVESAAVISYSNFPPGMNPCDRSSAPLGELVNGLYSDYHPHKIYIGVGGTAVCDGGAGFLDALDRNIPLAATLHGLVDVSVPLMPPIPGAPSALMFCRQKGFTDDDIPRVVEKLRRTVQRYGPAVNIYDGAGGGLGYAISSVIGAPCEPGAAFILKKANIPWSQIDCLVTGEGRYDRQTDRGKVVAAMAAEGASRGIPTVCFAGSVEPGARIPEGMSLVDLSEWLPDEPLTPSVAAERLASGCRHFFKDRHFAILK